MTTTTPAATNKESLCRLPLWAQRESSTVYLAGTTLSGQATVCLRAARERRGEDPGGRKRRRAEAGTRQERRNVKG
ncbi:hypothetical protein E2C01_091004 [Portunus trituberculatus]|uniref:Uncharacterized protein n=1 Tax=Portunus trituberculatus TaxID=210409 RepID=A0A5B7JRV0_PORTR|nr:hypothetical protein [Portunus trituberculatus]